jgi:hypothetical protein
MVSMTRDNRYRIILKNQDFRKVVIAFFQLFFIYNPSEHLENGGENSKTPLAALEVYVGPL